MDTDDGTNRQMKREWPAVPMSAAAKWKQKHDKGTQGKVGGKEFVSQPHTVPSKSMVSAAEQNQKVTAARTSDPHDAECEPREASGNWRLAKRMKSVRKPFGLHLPELSKRPSIKSNTSQSDQSRRDDAAPESTQFKPSPAKSKAANKFRMKQLEKIATPGPALGMDVSVEPSHGHTVSHYIDSTQGLQVKAPLAKGGKQVEVEEEISVSKPPKSPQSSVKRKRESWIRRSVNKRLGRGQHNTSIRTQSETMSKRSFSHSLDEDTCKSLDDPSVFRRRSRAAIVCRSKLERQKSHEQLSQIPATKRNLSGYEGDFASAAASVDITDCVASAEYATMSEGSSAKPHTADKFKHKRYNTKVALPLSDSLCRSDILPAAVGSGGGTYSGYNDMQGRCSIPDDSCSTARHAQKSTATSLYPKVYNSLSTEENDEGDTSKEKDDDADDEGDEEEEDGSEFDSMLKSSSSDLSGMYKEFVVDRPVRVFDTTPCNSPRGSLASRDDPPEEMEPEKWPRIHLLPARRLVSGTGSLKLHRFTIEWRTFRGVYSVIGDLRRGAVEIEHLVVHGVPDCPMQVLFTLSQYCPRVTIECISYDYLCRGHMQSTLSDWNLARKRILNAANLDQDDPNCHFRQVDIVNTYDSDNVEDVLLYQKLIKFIRNQNRCVRKGSGLLVIAWHRDVPNYTIRYHNTLLFHGGLSLATMTLGCFILGRLQKEVTVAFNFATQTVALNEQLDILVQRLFNMSCIRRIWLGFMSGDVEVSHKLAKKFLSLLCCNRNITDFEILPRRYHRHYLTWLYERLLKLKILNQLTVVHLVCTSPVHFDCVKALLHDVRNIWLIRVTIFDVAQRVREEVGNYVLLFRFLKAVLRTPEVRLLIYR